MDMEYLRIMSRRFIGIVNLPSREMPMLNTVWDFVMRMDKVWPKIPNRPSIGKIWLFKTGIDPTIKTDEYEKNFLFYRFVAMDRSADRGADQGKGGIVGGN